MNMRDERAAIARLKAKAAARATGSGRADFIRLRDHIAVLPAGAFSIAGSSDCLRNGTGCIAGHGHDLLGYERFMAATDAVMPDDQFADLIMPAGYRANAERYTIPVVVRCLDHLIETGVVDWPRAFGETA